MRRKSTTTSPAVQMSAPPTIAGMVKDRMTQNDAAGMSFASQALTLIAAAATTAMIPAMRRISGMLATLGGGCRAVK